MDKVFIYGKTVQCTTVTGLRTASKAAESTNGKTGVHTPANGKITICMEREFTPGQTEESIKVSTRWIRNTASESTDGLTDESTKAIGLMESSMVLASMCSKTPL